ncbi:hypothetical protein T10_7409 [Trichinella papuae]|uniref:Uncharacterized protein n=1 Tax=Trichinella papuae TaxID=268474 RepID=A0A0V1MEK7_9BILA|nr:hypothetical protein T10_7409 [Trichinella papuae]
MCIIKHSALTSILKFVNMGWHLNNKNSEKQYAKQRMLKKTCIWLMSKIYNYSNAKLTDIILTRNEFCHQPCGFMRNFLHSDQLD